MKVPSLALQTGVDLPFPAARLNIHQPRIKEIAMITEESFFIGCEALRFSKNSLTSEDKINLESQSDFDIIMSIMKDRSNMNAQHSAISATMLLTLLFPDYKIAFGTDKIILQTDEEDLYIDNQNYNDFKDILVSMFCLTDKVEKEYNPKGDLANKIADKFKKRKKSNQDTLKDVSISIFDRYISILAVGLGKDKNILSNYTVYQLMDEFERFQAKEEYDTILKAKLAGAKDVQPVDSWMRDFHSKSIKN